MLQHVPGHRLGLTVEGSDVRETWGRVRAESGMFDEFVDGEYRFAETTMANEQSETLFPVMRLRLKWAGSVWDFNYRHLTNRQ